MKQRCLGCMSEYESDLGLCPHCGYEPGTPAENPLHLQPGTELNGRYTIGRVLGYGGFGVTYIAFDNVLNQKVAVKEYLPSEFATRMSGNSQVSVFSGNKAEQFADGMLKFVDEAKRLAKFQSAEGIVRVFDSFEANETAYITMEYLEGETLTAYLDREGKIPPEQAVSLLEPIVRSLETVHQAGIIHRDIAPDNIFLTSDGRVKLIDFGAARYATTSHSRSLTVIIKAGYSPEEQYRSRGDQGPCTDVYALAAVLYRMITGTTPPDALERRAILENKKKDILLPPSKFCEIDSNLENAILNAMNVRIEDRTASAQEFWNELTADSVKRRGNRVQALNLSRWPLGLKIGIPVLGVAALTLIGLLLTGVIAPPAISAGELTIGEGMTRVPGVINYSIGVAQEMLEKQQLAPVISGREPSDIIPPDLVLTQSVDAGEVVEANTQVGLFISEQMENQPEEHHAPDVMYYTEQDAVEQFRLQGIEPKLEYIYSSDVAEGLVVDQSVPGGDELSEGAEVVLTISRGPDPADTETARDPAAPKPLKLNRSSLSLYAGDTVTLSATGGSGNYQWSSNAGSVASVQGGVVTAVGAGKATITVSSGTEKATCPVTVRKYSLTVSPDSAELSAGETIQLTASGAPVGTEIEWLSTDGSVATVSGGLVTAVGAGNTTITARARYGGLTHDTFCRVTVKGAESEEAPSSRAEDLLSNPEPGAQIKMVSEGDLSSQSMEVGEKAEIACSLPTTLLGISPKDIQVAWSSSNPSVVTIGSESHSMSSSNSPSFVINSSAVISAVGEGKAVLSLKSSYNGQVIDTVDLYEITVSSSSKSQSSTASSPDGSSGSSSEWSYESSSESSSEWTWKWSPESGPYLEESTPGDTNFWEDPDFDHEAYLKSMWGSAEG